MPMQFTTTDSHLSAYADVLEHKSYTAYVKDSFTVSSSSVMHYVLIRPSIKWNAEPTASVLERFYNVYSTMSQWREPYTASDKLTIIKCAEVRGNRAAERQCDGD